MTFSRRPPFTLALVGLVVVLTGLTGGVIGGLAWHEQRERSRLLVDAAMAQAARLTAAHAGRVLEDAESVARLGPQLVAQGQLDPADARALERFTLAVLRAHPGLSWVSYGDRHDRFIGAWRDTRGTIYVNRSYPAGGRIRLEEDRVLADGRREVVRRSDDHGYRPRERPYFRAAASARRRRGLPELAMGIGLHVGTVVAGNIGSPERVKYGVVGPAVNLLSRIQTLTVGGEILMSDALLARVGAVATAGPGREERVKGVSEPVTVHRLLGAAAPGEAPLTSSRRD